MSDQVAAETPKIPPIRLVRVVEADNQLGLRTRTIAVDAASVRYRDKGKVFLITEKTAMQAELFAVKVLNILASSGVELGGDAMQMGLRGLAQHGVQALGRLPIELVKDLFDEMMGCVQIYSDYKAAPHITRALVDNDIQEVPTLMLMKMEVFDLHTGFFEPGDLSTSSQEGKAGLTGTGSVHTPTSQRRLGPQSHQVGRR